MKLTDAACTSIRTSSPAGFGSSMSAIARSSGPVNALQSTALIVALHRPRAKHSPQLAKHIEQLSGYGSRRGDHGGMRRVDLCIPPVTTRLNLLGNARKRSVGRVTRAEDIALWNVLGGNPAEIGRVA